MFRMVTNRQPSSYIRIQNCGFLAELVHILRHSASVVYSDFKSISNGRRVILFLLLSLVT